MTNASVLVFGGSGFVGAKLTQAIIKHGFRVAYTYFTTKQQLQCNSFQVDVSDAKAVHQCIRDFQPTIIVYCAKPPLKADYRTHRIVNIEGVRCLKEMIDPERCRLIYVSTNAVFNGKCGNYAETDAPDIDFNEESYQYYAITKAQGEKTLRDMWDNCVVVRTSDVNGMDINGNLNLRMKYVVRLLEERMEFERIANWYMSPTLVNDVVEGLLRTCCKLDFMKGGVLHISGSERMSYYQFSKLIARRIGLSEDLIIPISCERRDLSLKSTYSQRMLGFECRKSCDQLEIIFPNYNL